MIHLENATYMSDSFEQKKGLTWRGSPSSLSAGGLARGGKWGAEVKGLGGSPVEDELPFPNALSPPSLST